LNAFLSLLGENRNYRYTWIGQVVSEIGDHFNNVAVFSLAVAVTKSPLVVSGVLLARAVPAMLAGPLAGVTLDRFDRKRVMIASDLIRTVLAAGFIYAAKHPDPRLLYILSALLMLASPFFTSGRAAILPSIATSEELHAANSLTQTTGWTTLAVGAFLGGTSVMAFGYQWAFAVNALSFLISALCISQLRIPGGFRARRRQALTEAEVVRPWHEYVEGLRYVKSVPLVFGLMMVGVGWATGGGAAQILFTVFGEMVFNRGPAGLGAIWGCAGLGLVIGGTIAYNFGKRLSFRDYKRTISICYIVHGGSYEHVAVAAHGAG
jgi:MFS family permease